VTTAALSPARPSRARIWIQAARPRTLTAAVIPVLTGTTLALAEGHAFRAGIFLCTLLSALFIQIGTNLVNDAEDFKRGADTAERVGPLRVAQAGWLTADQVLRGAWVCLGLSFALGVPLIVAGGWPLLVVGLASIVAAYAYTGGPYPLAYWGLGDVFVMLFFGLIAVSGTYYLQSGTLSTGALIVGLAVGALATILLAVNNLRDVTTDRQHNKKTLAVRFGVGFAKREIAACAFAPFLVPVLLLSQGWWVAGLLPWLALPLAWRVVRISRQNKGADLNRALGAGAALHALYGTLLTLGFLVAWLRG
jgi:1,4-dihydroxy-2-naphthoate octaprenyltransferase